MKHKHRLLAENNFMSYGLNSIQLYSKPRKSLRRKTPLGLLLGD